MTSKTIRIKRSARIFQSKEEAVSFLSRISHIPGQFVMARYETEENSVDSVIALGVGSGSGPGNYSIVSTSGIRIVSGVAESEQDLPDVSSLINSETWVYKEPGTGDLYWIYLNNSTREARPIESDLHYRILSSQDNSEYWIYNNKILQVDNFYSREDTDEIVSTTRRQMMQRVDNVEENANYGLSSIREGAGLLPTGQYSGTIGGATSLDTADQILETRIDTAVSALTGLRNRVTDLEREFLSETDGLSTITRLDSVYTWYDVETHKPVCGVTFRKVTPGPCYAGTTQTFIATFTWSWANRAGWTGIRIDGTTKNFSSETIGSPNVSEGSYDWILTWTVPDNTDVVSKTWVASFVGETPVDDVVYTVESVPVIASVTINWPAQGSSDYTVTFTGTGIPGSWEGNEMSVRQGSSKVFSKTTTRGYDQNEVYTGHLGAGAYTVTASWSGITREIQFVPTYYKVVHGAPDTISPSGATHCFIPGREMTIPEHTYSSGDTLIVFSPYSLAGARIFFTGPSQGTPVEITSDWTAPGTLSYQGVTYQYMCFHDMGAGTFIFNIQ